jgi:hypothetical protein
MPDVRHDGFDFARLPVERRNAAGRDHDHLVAVRGERVLMEVKALRAGLARKAHDTMARGGIDPLRRRILGRENAQASQSQYQNRKDAFH